jgi:hypothetical protein
MVEGSRRSERLTPGREDRSRIIHYDRWRKSSQILQNNFKEPLFSGILEEELDIEARPRRVHRRDRVQRSQFEGSFSINVGVLTKSVHEVEWGGELPGYPKAYDCPVEERLGVTMRAKSAHPRLSSPRRTALELRI